MRRSGVTGARWLGLVVAVGLLLWAGGGLRSADADGIAWELTPLRGPVCCLQATRDGALFARSTDGLVRGDDAGTTWRVVSLPESLRSLRRPLVVNPTGSSVIFGAGPDGLYRAVDGATWQLILPLEQRVLEIAVSPADGNLVYLALSGDWGTSPDFRLLRSDDGGSSWQQLEDAHDSTCGWGVWLLQPHPSDPNRVFRASGCYDYEKRDLGDDLEESRDRGASWSRLFSPRQVFPTQLLGGEGAMPGRYYLAAQHHPRTGGWSLFRSDDDGITWNGLLDLVGVEAPGRPEDMGVEIRLLAYDPRAPDTVFISLHASTGVATKVSTDAGTTWADFGYSELGTIDDLEFSADGQYLFAATDRGLWRRPRAPLGPRRAAAGGEYRSVSIVGHLPGP